MLATQSVTVTHPVTDPPLQL